MNAGVDTAMVGSTTGRLPISWSERDTMLYALGVGAGSHAPEAELNLTTENSEGFELEALPSFLATFPVGNLPPAFDGVDKGRLLHAEQEIELFAPLPKSGSGSIVTTTDEVRDKGESAIVYNSTTLWLDGMQAPAARSRQGIFVRGAGGFGGPRGTTVARSLPGRAPDALVEHTTDPGQALIYRLSGDRNRLHSDPAFARTQGFARPILHGLCTYGFACRALVATVCRGRPCVLRAMSGQFRRPVYPGDALTTKIWENPDGVVFTVHNGAGDAVIDHGRAFLRTRN